MIRRPLILCPVEFSDACRAGLRYAAAIAEYFQSDLVVATVNDPLSNDAVAMTAGEGWLGKATARDLESFYRETFPSAREPLVRPRFESAVGNPALEILAMAARCSADLIVMSSRGASGTRRMFFGSTTERVLRETAVPVLVTPPDGSGPADSVDVAKRLRRVLVAVDLSPTTAGQVGTALGIAGALDVPMLLLHVLEPVHSNRAVLRAIRGIATERRGRAERALASFAEAAPVGARVEALLAFGEPSEEIVKVAHDRDAGLIVIGLHGPPLNGPHLGSVTYRVLCLSPAPVLALPPLAAARVAAPPDRCHLGTSAQPAAR